MRQMFSLTTVYLIHHKFVFLLVVVFCLPFFLNTPLFLFSPHTHITVRLVTPNQCLTASWGRGHFLALFCAQYTQEHLQQNICWGNQQEKLLQYSQWFRWKPGKTSDVPGVSAGTWENMLLQSVFLFTVACLQSLQSGIYHHRIKSISKKKAFSSTLTVFKPYQVLKRKASSRPNSPFTVIFTKPNALLI